MARNWKLTVVDGQGGGVGRAIIEGVRRRAPDMLIIACGANALATAAMVKAGATAGATGDNAVAVNCRDADVITGPVGILVADAMHGEITPATAAAVGASRALKIVLPAARCGVVVAGTPDKPLAYYLEQTVDAIVQAYERATEDTL